jgi:hypothetical protein
MEYFPFALKNDMIAGWSSPVARWAHNPKVSGSNPDPATNKSAKLSEKHNLSFADPIFEGLRHYNTDGIFPWHAAREFIAANNLKIDDEDHYQAHTNLAIYLFRYLFYYLFESLINLYCLHFTIGGPKCSTRFWD